MLVKVPPQVLRHVRAPVAIVYRREAPVRGEEELVFHVRPVPLHEQVKKTCAQEMGACSAFPRDGTLPNERIRMHFVGVPVSKLSNVPRQSALGPRRSDTTHVR